MTTPEPRTDWIEPCPEWVMFQATDINGSVWGFAKQPEARKRTWGNTEQFHDWQYDKLADGPEPSDFRATLVARPQRTLQDASPGLKALHDFEERSRHSKLLIGHPPIATPEPAQETPETDVELGMCGVINPKKTNSYLLPIEFAQSLERRLHQSTTENTKLKTALEKIKELPYAPACHIARAALEETKG